MSEHIARHARTARQEVWVPRREFDADRRAAAAALDAAERAWSVSYSVELRCFVAFPCWEGAPNGLVVRDVSTGGMVAAMRRAETDATRDRLFAGWPQ